MTRPNVHIINVETQEEIIREMNDEEYEQSLADKAAYEAELALQVEAEEVKAAKAAAKAEALAALGLSQEVINLLAD